jgi:hypothetical protein
MASSTGKKSIMTGVNRVPSPKPEKKVRIAATNAVRDMTMISIRV